MRRIGLAVVLALGVILAPVIAETQPAGKVPRIGYLVLAPLAERPSPERAAFVAGLRELGRIEGKTIAIVYRSAQSNPELLDDLAEDLVRMKVDVIVTAGSNALLRAAARATSTIPIVMPGSADPVAEGLVASLARPGVRDLIGGPLVGRVASITPASHFLVCVEHVLRGKRGAG